MKNESRSIPPIVSTDWLEDNMDDPDVVIVDVRDKEEYEEGHIPNSISAPAGAWASSEKEGLILPLPEAEELSGIISSFGINGDSKVVVVTKTTDSFSLADAMKVADTLLYGGIEDVAILNGGCTKWESEGKSISKEVVEPESGDYQAEADEKMYVTKEDVREAIGETTIIDARTPEAYFGAIQEPFTERPGHIPTAQCLPTPWIWTEEGTFKDGEELEELASGTVGEDKSEEVIIYCGASPFATSWRYVLREMRGYENIKVYNGSAQEWTMDSDLPLNRYCWE